MRLKPPVVSLRPNALMPSKITFIRSELMAGRVWSGFCWRIKAFTNALQLRGWPVGPHAVARDPSSENYS